MSNEMAVTCFADIKNSTPQNEQLGNEGFAIIRDKFLEVGKQLAINCNGNYVKSIGDCHMVTFNSLDDPFKFTSQLQQYYSPSNCYDIPPIRVRIGMYLGVVDARTDDVFGSGVNQAARVEGHAAPNEIWVNKELFTAISKVWNRYKAEKYLTSKGKFELRGIKDPPKQELFSFNWTNYVQDFPDKGLQQLVFEHLQNASIVPSNFTVTDMSTHNYVIWPVVPRNIVNAIHRGQLEMIRLLTILGWRVHVLIADCGAIDNTTRQYSEIFQREIVRYAKLRSMKNFNFSFLRDLYEPGSSNCQQRHRLFQSVISDLTLNDMLNINTVPL